MAEGGTPLRRSTRHKKETSYKDIEGLDEISCSREGQDDLDNLPRHRKLGPKRKSFEPTPTNISSDIRAKTIHSTSRDGRMYALAGSDEYMRRQLFEKMEKWRNVCDEVPPELLDYTVGWGVCPGDWNGKGGERQQFKTFSYCSMLNH